MEKRCPACGLVKDATEFGRNKRTSDGLACYCKPCTSGLNRAQYLANQERRKTEARDFRSANGEVIRERDRERWQRRKGGMATYRKANRSRINETRRAWFARRENYFRDWRRANSDRIAYEKAWREANWEAVLLHAHQRYLSNPERFTIARNKYRARVRDTTRVPYTADQLRQKFEYHGGRCWICRKLLLPGFHWDHVKPIKQGGWDMLSNLRPACGPCNKAKSNQWPFSPSC